MIRGGSEELYPPFSTCCQPPADEADGLLLASAPEESNSWSSSTVDQHGPLDTPSDTGIAALQRPR